MSTQRLDQLRALLAEEPADVFLQYAISLELRRLGRTSEAIEILGRLAQSHPEHIATYYQLASLLAESGNQQDALAACDAGMLRCLILSDTKTRSELASLRASIADDDTE